MLLVEPVASGHYDILMSNSAMATFDKKKRVWSDFKKKESGAISENLKKKSLEQKSLAGLSKSRGWIFYVN